MNKNQFTKADALKLVASVVDNEASEEEREAFFNFIANDEDVRKKYESLKNLKTFVSKRCPRACAPLSLRSKVMNFINKSKTDLQAGADVPIYDIPTEGPSLHGIGRKTRLPIQGFSSLKYLG